jgi:hypothetical protein
MNEEDHDSCDAGEIKVVIGCGKFVLKRTSANDRLILIEMVVKEGSK